MPRSMSCAICLLVNDCSATGVTYLVLLEVCLQCGKIPGCCSRANGASTHAELVCKAG